MSDEIDEDVCSECGCIEEDCECEIELEDEAEI
jgi:hypothetical protein